MSERTEIQQPIIRRLVSRGWLVLRVNGGRRGNVWFYIWYTINLAAQFAGCTDIIGCTDTGRFFCVELKVPGKKPRKTQVAFMAEMARRGGLVAVVDSADWQPPDDWH